MHFFSQDIHFLSLSGNLFFKEINFLLEIFFIWKCVFSREIHLFSLGNPFLFLGESIFSGNCQVMSTHHSDQMSQRSQVSRVALCMSKVKVCNLTVTWLSSSGQLKRKVPRLILVDNIQTSETKIWKFRKNTIRKNQIEKNRVNIKLCHWVPKVPFLSEKTFTNFFKSGCTCRDDHFVSFHSSHARVISVMSVSRL